MFGALKRGRFRSLASLILVVLMLANFNGKEHLRHRAVSLRQHGFLVLLIITVRCIGVKEHNIH